MTNIVLASVQQITESNNIPAWVQALALARRRPAFVLAHRTTESQRLVQQYHLVSDIERNAGKAQLLILWELYVTGLWLDYQPRDGEGKLDGHYTWMQFVDDTLTDDLNAGYQKDLGRIVERVLQFVYSTRIMLENDKRLTPIELVNKSGVRRLKKVSQAFSRTRVGDLQLRRNLVVAAYQNKDEQIESLVNNHITESTSVNGKLPLGNITMHALPNGTWEIKFNVSHDQLPMVETLLGFYGNLVKE